MFNSEVKELINDYLKISGSKSCKSNYDGFIYRITFSDKTVIMGLDQDQLVIKLTKRIMKIKLKR